MRATVLTTGTVPVSRVSSQVLAQMGLLFAGLNWPSDAQMFNPQHPRRIWLGSKLEVFAMTFCQLQHAALHEFHTCMSLQ